MLVARVFGGYGGLVSEFYGPVQQRTGEDVEELVRHTPGGTLGRLVPSTLLAFPDGTRKLAVTTIGAMPRSRGRRSYARPAGVTFLFDPPEAP